ncbi:TIGR01777 family oxidoreductase [Flexithrix dorotheae]|uniref:TIGR01777 family oxidoreductase n=1 Tax=Flexithrix dorotheae TaxID=70993 RepID=UPI0005C77A39|nr:TIGR01777 family oxidoreductase [Flexithrix dorotheae]
MLIQYYLRKGMEVVVLSRKSQATNGNLRYVYWDGVNLDDWAKELENALAVVNLAGKSVDCRYNEKNKKEIYDSRLNSTAVLGKAILACEKPPKVWINAASATIYRHAEDRPMDEITGEIGTGFSVDVCEKWEAVFNQINTPRTRKVLMRLAMVFGKTGGVIVPFKNLVKLGLGGHQGKGTQYMSWLHEKDFAEIINWMIQNDSATGIYNCSSPNPVPNKEFMSAFRAAFRQKIGIPAMEWMVKIGVFLMSTEAELILKSRRVIPTRLLKDGYHFQYEKIDEALNDLAN